MDNMEQLIEKNNALLFEVAKRFAAIKDMPTKEELDNARALAFSMEKEIAFLEGIYKNVMQYIWMNAHKCEVCKQLVGYLNENMDNYFKQKEAANGNTEGKDR